MIKFYNLLKEIIFKEQTKSRTLQLMNSRTWLNRLDVAQPLLFSLNWCTREFVELRLRGSATTRYALNLVPKLKESTERTNF